MANKVNDEESPIKVIWRDVHINELLCFVMCKSKVLTNVHLSKLCCDTYDEKTIRSAKDMLLKCVSIPDNDKRKKRRHTQVKATMMQDIMSIFYEMSLDDVPKFDVQNLNILPPLPMDSFDMSRIIHEMTSVKSQLQKLQEAQETILNAHSALCEKSQVVEKITSLLSRVYRQIPHRMLTLRPYITRVQMVQNRSRALRMTILTMAWMEMMMTL